MTQPLVDVEEVDDPTPQRAAPRLRLGTLHEIRLEMAAVYREARARKLAPDEASKLFYMLGVLAKTTEVAVAAKRLVEIEDLLKERLYGIDNQR